GGVEVQIRLGVGADLAWVGEEEREVADRGEDRGYQALPAGARRATPPADQRRRRARRRADSSANSSSAARGVPSQLHRAAHSTAPAPSAARRSPSDST